MSPKIKAIKAGSQTFKDEVYVFGGLNMVMPDQIIDSSKSLAGQSPYTINSRMFSRSTGEKRVPIRTRKGSTVLMGSHDGSDTPLTIANTNSKSGEQEFSNVLQYAFYATWPDYSIAAGYGYYSLTFIDLDIRKDTGAIESINVNAWTDNNGFPGSLLASSSIELSSVTGTSSTQRAWFMDAPAILKNQKVWITIDVTSETTVKCYIDVTSNAGGYTHPIDTVNYLYSATGTTATYNIDSYRSGGVLSAFRRYVVGETPSTLVATGYGDILQILDDGTTTVVYSYAPGYEKVDNRFRFLQVDDRTVIVNGSIQPGYIDATGFHSLTNAPAAAEEVLLWNNRLMMRVGNKTSFTDIMVPLSNMNSWPAVNYFYPNTALDPDVVVGIVQLKQELYVFTKLTRYRFITTDGGTIASTSGEAVKGAKGAMSRDLIKVYGEFIYFVGSDSRFYQTNGLDDQLLSDNVEPEIRSMQTPATYSFLHMHDNQARIYYLKSTDTAVCRMLLYSLVDKEWFMDTGKNVAFSIDYPLEGGTLVEFSSKATLGFLGEQNNYSDAGKAIDFKYWTSYKAYGSGAAKKRIKKFRPILQSESGSFVMSIGKDMNFRNTPDMRDYLVDGGGTTYGGGASYGDGSSYGSGTMIDTPSGMSGRGNHIQYRFEKKGVKTPVLLYGYVSIYKEGTAK